MSLNFHAFGRRTLLAFAATAALAGFAGGSAQAQSQAPLRVILPVGAGSGVDVIVRSAQNALSRALGGQAVVIENLPGAGGITGTQALVKAAPDGNTIAVLSNNHAVNPSVFKKLPYDSLSDITPITIVGGSPFVLVVNPHKVAAKNARELQAAMKARPGEFNYASSGNGTIIHLAGELFVSEAGVSARHIPYKGMGPMITDIMAGQVEMGAAAVAAVQGQIKAGTLRPIGVMGKERVNSLPEVSTIAEQGLPNVDIAGWFAAVAPKGLPAAQVKRLHDAFVTAFNDPEVKAGFAKRDDFTILGTPEEAARFLKSEQERYAALVKKANVTLE
ncbi:tripartite tricarboxylate transporter substrate binding protein [Xenophilus arseniciresistens]|uniref:Tripartite tricarboxylate transporter substrate binding protein n=1 Tax=Xenophilus arseniciresistens TaxID=1283306 RepID=A0AAE3N6D6_9BURK|nr:tripartite tricarboxylate transporter substrate binding protein [Xenophilus arseniciresistens]MDA7414792.1 tripartite tricarboxylate transporter substrate binding protein [Xenophilus arseniciresistens]